MPTDTAATSSPNGDGRPVRAASQAHASASATQPPVMAAVRVPPSAWRTSQSTRMVYSPKAIVPIAARSERPMRRWISWLRPPGPLRSRAVRSRVARGSMAYSAVTHPSPLPFLKGGTPSSTLAVQWTRVPPARIRQEPSAYGLAPRSSARGRSWSGDRPSGRGTAALHEGGGGITRDERDGDDPAAGGLHQVGADDRLGGVVASLDEDLGPQGGDDREGGRGVEQHHPVHRRQPGDHPGPGALVGDGAPGPLRQLPDRAVGVHRHEQVAPESAGLLEILDMAGVEQVEDAVGEDQAAGECAPPGDGGIERDDLVGAGAHPRYWRTSTSGRMVSTLCWNGRSTSTWYSVLIETTGGLLVRLMTKCLASAGSPRSCAMPPRWRMISGSERVCANLALDSISSLSR